MKGEERVALNIKQLAFIGDVVVAVEAVLCVQQRPGTAAHAAMLPLHLLLHTCAPARLLCLQMALASAFLCIFWLDIACICPPYIAA